MRHITLRLSVFVTSLLILLNTVDLFAPYCWGNPTYCAKLERAQNNLDEYNTLFFGSSKIYRHVDPFRFDRRVTRPITSFNTAFAGTYTPESYYLYEHFLTHIDTSAIHYAFLELQPIRSLPDENLHATRVKYFLNYRDYGFAVRSTWNNTAIGTSERYRTIRNYTISYAENLFKVGLLKQIAEGMLFGFKQRMYAPENRGFYSLEANINGAVRDAKGIKQRREDFLANPSGLAQRRKETQEAYDAPRPLDYDQAHLKRINHLIALSKEKNIHLIFVLPPRLIPTAYHTLLPLRDRIDKRHIIDLGNPRRHPEFYNLDYSFDIGHFNDAGSRLFTVKLAIQFNNILASS